MARRKGLLSTRGIVVALIATMVAVIVLASATEAWDHARDDLDAEEAIAANRAVESNPTDALTVHLAPAIGPAVQRLGGRIWIEDSAEGGTCVAFTLRAG